VIEGFYFPFSILLLSDFIKYLGLVNNGWFSFATTWLTPQNMLASIRLYISSFLLLWFSVADKILIFFFFFKLCSASDKRLDWLGKRVVATSLCFRCSWNLLSVCFKPFMPGCLVELTSLPCNSSATRLKLHLSCMNLFHILPVVLRNMDTFRSNIHGKYPRAGLTMFYSLSLSLSTWAFWHQCLVWDGFRHRAQLEKQIKI